MGLRSVLRARQARSPASSGSRAWGGVGVVRKRCNKDAEAHRLPQVRKEFIYPWVGETL